MPTRQKGVTYADGMLQKLWKIQEQKSKLLTFKIFFKKRFDVSNVFFI